MNQAYAISSVIGLALTGLVTSNFLHDHGLDNSISRCIGGILGGLVFLAAALWLELWIAITVAGGMTLFIFIIRWKFRQELRGTQGRRTDQSWAEVMYALGGTISLAVGWGLFGDKWLAFLPIAFMAWGDNAASLTRATVWPDKKASIVWPSIVMLSVCIAVAALVHPLWVGVVGAVITTAIFSR